MCDPAEPPNAGKKAESSEDGFRGPKRPLIISEAYQEIVRPPVVKSARRAVSLRPVTIRRVLSTGHTERLIGWPLSVAQSPVTPVRRRVMRKDLPELARQDAKSANGSRVKQGVANRSDVPADERQSVVVKANLSYAREKSRGLRYFSMRVCDKVKDKVVTTYNEVADELVQEYYLDSSLSYMQAGYMPTESSKNIRRRVYDAINVLMAMNIISKEKKEIRWVGFPSSAKNECKSLEETRRLMYLRMQDKSNMLRNLILYNVCLRQLIDRNQRLYPGLVGRKRSEISEAKICRLPLVIAHFCKDNPVECYVSTNKREFAFLFGQPFYVQGDETVLIDMGMTFGLSDGKCPPSNVAKICRLMPRMFDAYIRQMSGSKLLVPAPLEFNSRRKDPEQVKRT